jgi:hypothetical protein
MSTQQASDLGPFLVYMHELCVTHLTHHIMKGMNPVLNLSGLVHPHKPKCQASRIAGDVACTHNRKS